MGRRVIIKNLASAAGDPAAGGRHAVGTVAMVFRMREAI